MLGQPLDARGVESASIVDLFEPQSHFLPRKLLKEQVDNRVKCGLPLAIRAGLVQLVEDSRAS